MKLVENWKAKLLKAWSVRVHAAFAVLAGLIVANPGIVYWAVNQLPEGPARWLAVGGTSFIVFGAPTLARLLKQGNVTDA